MQAEKDMHKLVKNDEHHTVGRDRTRGVKRNENVSVGKNRTKRVKRNERVVIGQNQSVTVGTNRTAQIGGNDSVTVGGQHVLTVTDMFGGTGTTITTASHLIKLDSGMGATLMLNGANIRLQADSIDLVGTSGITVSVSGGEVKINGGPNVVINGPGLRAARVTDPVGGKILEGSPTVFIGPAPPAPTTDEETIDQAIENIKASPFGQTPEGRRVIAKIEQLRREGKIRFADLGPSIRGQSGSDGITANTTYNRDPQGTASELVHEATHQLDDDDYPGKTGNSIDEEERTNTNQLDLYESQRRGGYRDPDLELRRADRLNGRLRDNIRGRYPTSPEQRPR